MAAAAKTVRHHVSDCLQDRHPYNSENGFETQRAKDAGKVFRGMLPVGIDQLLANLNDPSLDPSQRVVALKHLVGLSSSSEKKILLLRKNVVRSLAALLLRQDIAPQLELLSYQLLRSLAIIPQGGHSIIQDGALAALVTRLGNREKPGEREDARVAAAMVICQISSSWAGRSWLLGLPVPPDFELLNREEVSSSASAEHKENLATHLLQVLVGVAERDAASPKMLQYAVQSLAQITSQEEGLHRSLIAGALRVVDSVLQKFSKDGVWFQAENAVTLETVLHLTTIVWHVGLDEVGQKESLDLPLVQSLGGILATLAQSQGQGMSHKYYPLKAALAGALAALLLHPPNKEAAIAMQGDSGAPVEHIIQLLRGTNSLLEEVVKARKMSQPPPFTSPTFEDLVSVTKNCVQAVRLVAELPAGRTALHKILGAINVDNLNRQLFFSTTWQEEFNVQVY
jgi:hypothetical protein